MKQSDVLLAAGAKEQLGNRMKRANVHMVVRHHTDTDSNMSVTNACIRSTQACGDEDLITCVCALVPNSTGNMYNCSSAGTSSARSLLWPRVVPTALRRGPLETVGNRDRTSTTRNHQEEMHRVTFPGSLGFVCRLDNLSQPPARREALRDTYAEVLSQMGRYVLAVSRLSKMQRLPVNQLWEHVVGSCGDKERKVAAILWGHKCRIVNAGLCWDSRQNL